MPILDPGGRGLGASGELAAPYVVDFEKAAKATGEGSCRLVSVLFSLVQVRLMVQPRRPWF